TNHALTLAGGEATVAAGGIAIIAEDPAKFAADTPTYGSTVFKASFSLSNTGETLGLKDEAGDVVDSVSYDSSMGAAGDGNSLHRVAAQAGSGSSFVAGAPDPGAYSGATPATVVQNTSSGSTPTDSVAPASTASGSSSGAPAPLNPRITADTDITAGAGSLFSGSLSGAHDVRYLWNFGDGATAEGQTLSHTYSYPGTYAVVLTVAAGGASGMARTSVTADPAQLALLVEPDGSVVLSNQSSHELSVGLWSITSGTSTFVIPEHTYILGMQSVRFTTGVMGMVAGYDALVRYPNGQPATVAAALPTAPAVVQAPVYHAPLVAAAPQPHAATPTASSQAEVVPAAPTQAPDVSAPTVAAAAALAGVLAGGVSPVLLESILGLAALLVIGISGAWYVQSLSPRPPQDTVIDASEFSIDD
ncbi:MAG TPA: PKD domain-containing protein, partial [Gemmatimonadaceae bacterium]